MILTVEEQTDAHDGSRRTRDGITKNTPMWRFAMGDVIVLRSIPTNLTSAAGHQFVVDCVRAAEGLISDNDLRDKYELSPDDWKDITENTALIRAIQAERERRVRNGAAAREAAAQHFIKAPAVLDSIMCDSSASPRHRIESARELRQTALGSSGDESTADASEKFVITINLGADHVEHYEKTITPMKPLLPANEVKINDDE
jgi:hypothetical protein